MSPKKPAENPLYQHRFQVRCEQMHQALVCRMSWMLMVAGTAWALSSTQCRSMCDHCKLSDIKIVDQDVMDGYTMAPEYHIDIFADLCC